MEYIFTWNLFILYSNGRAHELRVLICLKCIGDVFDVLLHVMEYIFASNLYIV